MHMIHVIAFLLIICPSSSSSALPDFGDIYPYPIGVESVAFKAFSEAVCDVCCCCELMSPHERSTMFCVPQLHQSMRIVRDRWRDLWDAPYVADAARFPSRDVINNYLSMNTAYAAQLRVSVGNFGYSQDAIREAIKETERLWSCWNLIRDIQFSDYCVSTRRADLKELRYRIGYKAYYATELPPFIPIWRFQRSEGVNEFDRES